MFRKKRRNIAQCERGVAALEFALALPFMLAMFLGGFEVFRFVLINFKLEKTAYTISDVVSQQTSLTNSQLNQIISAAGQILQPYTLNTNGVAIITSVTKAAGSNAKVSWQRFGGGTLTRSSKIGQTGQDAIMPYSLTLNDKDNVIYTEVFYKYQPLIATDMFAAKESYKVAVFKPRLGQLSTAPN